MMKLSRPLAMLAARANQMGAASVAIAMLVMFMLVAAVLAIQNMSGSSVFDSEKSEEQVAALFLAESGVELVQATMKAAALSGTYDDAACKSLNGVSTPLPRGNVTYAATATPDPCGGSNPGCTSCTVDVTGAITASSTRRTVRTVITSTLKDGASGCADNFTLNIPVPGGLGQASVVTNVAWRAKGQGSPCNAGSNSNATVTSCTNTGPTGGTCILGKWTVNGTGTNNVNSMGVYALGPNPGTYTLSVGMTAPPGLTPTLRAFSATGVVLFPLLDIVAAPSLNGTVNFVGAYGDQGDTSSASSLVGNVPDGWTCGPNSTTPDTMSLAAGADTLFYGLSALGATAGNEATTMVFGSDYSGDTGSNQPMYRIVSLTDGLSDYLYSQSWVTYNPRYWPTAGATNGAIFTGTIGATFTADITAGGGTLNLNSALNANAILKQGDSITDGTVTGTLGTLISGTWGVNGSKYNITGVASPRPSATFTATSNGLHVVGPATEGILIPSDPITNSADSVTYGTLGASVSCSTTTGPGPCSAGDSVYTFTGTAIQLASQTMHTAGDGKTITVPVGMAIPPSAGTALAVSSGTGAFPSVSLVNTSSINGTILTVPSGTPQPVVGDALYGRFIKPGTRITAVLSGTTYTVTPSQTVTQATMQTGGPLLARAAVLGSDSIPPPSTYSATSFVVSRKPTTRLSGSAQLCGGVCPFLIPYTGSGGNKGTHFTITGLTSGHDWSSGFSCLNNVNPNNIRSISSITASQSNWSEPVR